MGDVWSCGRRWISAGPGSVCRLPNPTRGRTLWALGPLVTWMVMGVGCGQEGNPAGPFDAGLDMSAQPFSGQAGFAGGGPGQPAEGTPGDPGPGNAGAAGGEAPAEFMLDGGSPPIDISPQPADLPSCIDDPSDVVIVGDSYVNWGTHTFIPDLAAESGQTWPSYAVGGASMATGGLLGFIPDQFENAAAVNPNIKVVVMDGGGNDILLPDAFMFPNGAQCTQRTDSPTIADCQKIVATALDTAKTLMQRMADAGVQDIVYFFYPHIPGGGLISGPNPNQILDYALPRAREVCESAAAFTGGALRCHFVDMVPAFEGKTGLFSDAVSDAGDGVHPNSQGSKVMAAEVWKTMEQACIGQPASSGCCDPGHP